MSTRFLGKFTFLSTNTSAPQYYLTLVYGNNVDPLASLSSVEPMEWIAYDGGQYSGEQLLLFATPNPTQLFLYVNPSLGWVMADASPPESLAVLVSPASGIVSWQRVSSGSLQLAGYQFETNFKGLVFPSSGGDGVFTTLQQTLVTPGLPTIQSTLNAEGFDFQGVDLTGASLENVNCTGANFTNAILAGTNFSGATLTNAIFSGTDLTKTIWGTNLQASGAHFDHCVGCGALFLTDTTQAGTQATFTGADFSNADFSGALFAAYTAGNGSVTGANLSQALLFGANFSGASLPGADLTGISAGQSASGGNLGADFSRAYMPDVTLVDADLDGADLSFAQIYWLANGVVNSASMTNTNLTGADFTGMSFNGTQIAGASFDGAILVNCVFNNVAFGPSAQFLPVSMVRAHLEGVQFTGNSSLLQVHLSDAYIATANGIPLLTTPMQQAYATALNGGTVPKALPSIFANAGFLLAPSANVSSPAANSWALTQAPVSQTLGIEITGYSLLSDGTNLHVYGSVLALTEQSDRVTINLAGLLVSATGLNAQMLDAASRCPNHSTLASNQQLDLSWEQMLMAPRPALAAL